jgi:hypothetical protein
VYESPAFPGTAKAAVAQLVEQRIRNAWVGGSSPFRGTNDFNGLPIGSILFVSCVGGSKHTVSG